eukprot:4407669-Pleurochrysis_carterae.AAC.1
MLAPASPFSPARRHLRKHAHHAELADRHALLRRLGLSHHAQNFVRNCHLRGAAAAKQRQIAAFRRKQLGQQLA